MQENKRSSRPGLVDKHSSSVSNPGLEFTLPALRGEPYSVFCWDFKYSPYLGNPRRQSEI